MPGRTRTLHCFPPWGSTPIVSPSSGAGGVPRGGEWDRKEMDRYVRIAGTLREAGIEPVVTLHHFTNPSWLVSRSTWEDPSTAEEFLRFAERAVRSLPEKARGL